MASTESLRLNIDWAARGELGPPIIGEVLCNIKGEVEFMSSISILESRFRNEEEVIAILEVLQILSSGSKDGLIVESDFSMLYCR